MRTRYALALLSMLSGCLGDLEPEVGEPTVGRCRKEDTNPEQDVSYGADVAPLFARPGSMGGCSCHNSAAGTSGLSLASYSGMMRGGLNSGSGIVVAGDPCSSVLYLKVTEAPPFGARMPTSGPPFLSPQELQLVHDWIAEGADED